MRQLANIVIIFASLCAGCSTTDDASEGPEAPSLREELGARQPFELDAPSSSIAIVMAGNWIGEDVLVDLPLRSGTAVVGAQGDVLTLESLALDLEDVSFGSSGLLDEGGEIQHLAVSLERRASTDAAWEPARVEGDGELAIALGWSLRVGEQQLDLGDQTIGALPFSVSVEESGEDLHLELDASAEGTLWSLPPALELRRIEVTLAGAAR